MPNSKFQRTQPINRSNNQPAKSSRVIENKSYAEAAKVKTAQKQLNETLEQSKLIANRLEQLINVVHKFGSDISDKLKISVNNQPNQNNNV